VKQLQITLLDYFGQTAFSRHSLYTKINTISCNRSRFIRKNQVEKLFRSCERKWSAPSAPITQAFAVLIALVIRH